MNPERVVTSLNYRLSGGWSACLSIGFILLRLVGLTLVVGCAGRVPVSGLRPHYPEPSRGFVEVDSLRPTLSWEAFPRPIDLAGDKEGMRGRISNVTYDLRIWRADEESPREYPAEIAYARRGLREPWHTIEQPLMPSTMYFWSIRARFEFDRQPRVTQWGVTKWSYPGVPPFRHVPHPDHYRFETPSSPMHPIGQVVLSDAEALGRALARTQQKVATTMPQESQAAYLSRPKSRARSAEPAAAKSDHWLMGKWVGIRKSQWWREEAIVRITSYDQATQAFKGDGMLHADPTSNTRAPTTDLVIEAVVDEKGRVVMTIHEDGGSSSSFHLKRDRGNTLSGTTSYGLPRLTLEKKQ
ncbi:MAG: hypothetical protein ACE5MM_02360 [Nitrospiraceae bacterium]